MRTIYNNVGLKGVVEVAHRFFFFASIKTEVWIFTEYCRWEEWRRYNI